MSYQKPIPKQPDADTTLQMVLDDIAIAGFACHVLSKYEINEERVLLTYDQSKCAPATAGQGPKSSRAMVRKSTKAPPSRGRSKRKSRGR